jgi:hypothetical protein
MEIESFLESYDEIKQYSLQCEYKDEENPVDGVVYPLICKDIPVGAKYEALYKISELMGFVIKSPLCFLRRSPVGVHCPHKVHNDLSMGKFSCMIYLNDNPYGGTSFLTHLDTGLKVPGSENIEQFANDANDISKWRIDYTAQMKENKAVIFDASRFHAAMPFGGFGEGNNARTVMTVFFE